MNTVINIFLNDGTIVNKGNRSYSDVFFDYAQVDLTGNNAKNAKTTDRGSIMLVSSVDFDNVMRFKWYLSKSGYPMTYGNSTIKFGPITMHQMLFPNIPYGYVVDHINREKLDNRRTNLRVCTALENSYNKSKPKNSKRRYKGVSQSGKKNPTFTATITKNGTNYEIKNIQTEEQAAKVYDMMAEELFGKYAGKNFPDAV